MLVHTRHMGQDLEVLRRIVTHKGHKGRQIERGE